MKTLYLDTFSGVSGDMMLGLLVDLGVELASIEEQLAALPISGYQLQISSEKRHGIAGTRIKVACDQQQPTRTWTEIDRMLDESVLEDAVKETARRIFKRLGEAEAHVHKIALNEVHFHEVGAVDAIVDIVGSAIGLHQLNLDAIICSPLPLSNGMTKGGHGAIPLPAPATLQLLKEQPVCNADSDRELVTPTGAAIVVEVARFGTLPEMTVKAVGYGVGGWQLDDRPNLLRGIIGEQSAITGMEQDTVTVIETNIDDSAPEWLGALLEQLLDHGALDAAFTPLQMKKNRPGVQLTVISRPQDATRLARIILRESSAIGVRMHETRRIKLERKPATVETCLGAAEVKLVYDGETLLRITPEYDSCKKLAEQSGHPLPEIYRIVTSAANRQFRMEE